MQSRGIIRLAAAAAATALLVGGLGAPAHAADPFPGALLLLEEPVWAADAPTKGCAGIDTGTAVVGKDGWLFSKPEGRYTDLQYVFLFVKDDGEDEDDFIELLLNADGVATLDVSGIPTDPENPEALAKALGAKVLANKSADKLEFPTNPAPAGVTGALTDDGGWLRTPAGWALVIGGAFTDPPLKDATFNLVRACAAAAAPTSNAPSTPAGPQLPITGTNVWVLSGAGVALIAVGAVLFLAYRRRQSIKFVA
ncbi:LPXTG cell wall anchor domain-containing protein [Dactylosporangium cerinum]|uniref:LPXTG cell wall anchor domain-containing protein n=1 Tax=Dactylosporangium cerinum TaxID=1434730 RepID=A0ABV9WI58_9ACTN